MYKKRLRFSALSQKAEATSLSRGCDAKGLRVADRLPASVGAWLLR
ncbi:hypothetical protein ATH84_101840 [Paracoccus versutus]|uniref:Uncharacterized protein n=1 Tax=Paracoccus versutus TaxID=34007 RepID=A0AAQ0HIP1_PARVE|nr:hypothetical protein [Paracoccus versutus]REG45873.1 hypothetical protein ATH84_101840 [Paracoccus versutus]